MIIAALSIILFASCVSCADRLLPARVIPQNPNIEYNTRFKIFPSLARIHSMPGAVASDRGTGGTAFAVTPDLLMTAGHICASWARLYAEDKVAEKLHVHKVDGLGEDTLAGKATVKAFVNEGGKDICLLEFPDHGLLPLQLRSNLNNLETEDDVMTVGAPKNVFPVKRYGSIIRMSMPDDHHYADTIQLAINVQPGSSGAPLLWNGQVVGMIIATTSGIHNGRYLHNGGYAVRSNNLLRFIEENWD